MQIDTTSQKDEKAEESECVLAAAVVLAGAGPSLVDDNPCPCPQLWVNREAFCYEVYQLLWQQQWQHHADTMPNQYFLTTSQ